MTTPSRRTIDLGTTTVTALDYQAEDGPTASLVLAHGAGADQHSAFMTMCARGLAARGISTITFNFPYTEHGRRLPDRRPVLDACYAAIVSTVAGEVGRARPLFIGGKSMGGRIATHIAAADPALPVAGIVLLGYPLHPPGLPSRRRDAHLPAVERPMLFVQGSRDTFGTPGELASSLAAVRPAPDVHVVAGGDHSFKITRTARAEAGGPPATQDEVYDDVLQAVAEWIAGISAQSRPATARPSR